MRKLLLSFGCMLFMTGLVLATEVTLLKYDGDKKEVTVKEGDAEKTYKLTDKTAVLFIIDKDGTTRKATLDAAAKVLGNDNFKGKQFDITASKDTITEMKLKAKRGKN
jgi:hypothetical protein